MTTSEIIYEQRGSLAIVRLNRPEKLNALSREMITGVSNVFKHLENQPALRAVILTGAGERAFCVGTDLDKTAELRPEEISGRRQALCDQIERCAVPVIAAINGLAAGHGFELALACHLRIASANAQFVLPEPKSEAIHGGSQRLAREISAGRAFDMQLVGKTLSANEAFDLGLINNVREPAELIAEAESIAQQIAKLAPLAIHAVLEAVTRGLALTLADGLALETELFASLFATEDMREGTRAFLEKRPPAFKGR